MSEQAADGPSPLAHQVRVLIADFLDRPPEELAPERLLDDFNVDSFDFIELCFLIEEKTGLELEKDPSKIRAEVKTFADIYRLLENAQRKKAGAPA
ncbi:acyl carrier protein [Rhodospirillum rubrum]|uniref:Carrier domain-containing protein n=1 Tax=Rhodospirillum rubrum (strain ATCC 11170 / ATH 1.1.1 / DSM 467 / LMG 4362 / NCIMB 8255 / S1) TaxID=269796 RepID=Q2RXZ6_RHORT|nr:acyl carrier protein [Rhodospirillum rubrum]ABC20999.1 hypothetical protein Rru_A0194 [Rhodospirillum rubrum ATCC 11170]AEO46665.1 hypothetical protein F11_00975 [Rhodospirillum rubrum F11]MBK5952544.1 hypothetical protein [Rhodospirillum rubrum]QXG80695.1 acyl carrier protein [Rhodospirillum rubrum]HAP99311.1 acyl carrier protein [Rhodospirillum rubrum]